MKRQIIEMVIDEKGEMGVDAISVVENPAIESDFIFLSKQEDSEPEIKKLEGFKFDFKEVDAEKKILMGAALIPNKMIFRKQEGKEFYIFFSEDTVRKTSEAFFRNGNQNNSTLEHKEALQGLTVVESWIVEDEDKDKTSLYGLKVPKGTWMVSMKVDNQEVWDDFVKTGKVKGFSIEGYFVQKADLSSQKSNKDTEKRLSIMTPKEFFKNLKEMLSSVDDGEASETQLAQKKLDNGTVIESTDFAPDSEVFIVTEDGEDNKALPVGTYTMEDGSELVVQEEGVIASVGDPKPEEEEMSKDTVSREEYDSLKSQLDSLAAKLSKEEPKPAEEKTKEPKGTELSGQEEKPKGFKHSPDKGVEKQASKFNFTKKTPLERVFETLSK